MEVLTGNVHNELPEEMGANNSILTTRLLAN
jgi:hypothetical protein